VTEKELQNAILRAFGTLPALRLWRANVGVARLGRRVVRFGIPGQGDLTGILPDGRRVEIEVKAAAGRQTSAQRSFQEMIERFHGVYILASSVEDVRQRLAAVGVRLG
jgi:hypothetical protein